MHSVTIQYNSRGYMLVNTNIRMEETKRSRLEMIAKKQDRSLAYVIREAIDDYIKKTYGDNLETIEKLEEFAKRFEKKE